MRALSCDLTIAMYRMDLHLHGIYSTPGLVVHPKPCDPDWSFQMDHVAGSYSLSQKSDTRTVSEATSPHNIFTCS